MPRRRVPTDIARALDAEAHAFLKGKGQPLPVWVGLYRIPKPSGLGETVSILPQRGAPLRGAEPLVDGALPVRAAIITDAARLDPTARYIMRLWMARQRRRLAIRRNDRAGQRAAEALWSCLLANPPSLDRRARNIRSHNVTKQAETEKWKAKCQAEAARINKARIKKKLPKLTKTAIARQLREALGYKERTIRTIRGWL